MVKQWRKDDEIEDDDGENGWRKDNEIENDNGENGGEKMVKIKAKRWIIMVKMKAKREMMKW